MNSRYAWILVAVHALATASPAVAEISVTEPIRSAFYPYTTAYVREEGITSGTTISQQNWQIAEQVLPAKVLHLV